GIRDFHVTGVQTCALPISSCWSKCALRLLRYSLQFPLILYRSRTRFGQPSSGICTYSIPLESKARASAFFEKPRLRDSGSSRTRSEERRVGESGTDRRATW